MATSTYILSITDFTTRADLSDNIQTNRLKQYFGITQERFAVKMLCKEMYDAIIDQLSQGGESYLDANYATLLPYIKDYLVYKTMARYYANANYKSTPAGMRTHVDTISNQATPDQMRQLIDQANTDAEFYQDKLQNFLEDNRDSYPLWRDSSCNTCNNFTRATSNIRFGGNRSDRTRIKWS